MRKFSIRPTLTLKGRTFKGLRGWSGKPLHPPLTDIPIAAYFLAASFDVASAVAGKERAWARELWHSATVIFAVGIAVTLFAAGTGLVDAAASSQAGTQARRTINTHATIMSVATLLSVTDFIWRLAVYNDKAVTPALLAVLSVVVAALVSLGATFGGSLVYEYGFNVETAGDHPAYHRSETDVFPGDDDGEPS